MAIPGRITDSIDHTEWHITKRSLMTYDKMNMAIKVWLSLMKSTWKNGNQTDYKDFVI